MNNAVIEMKRLECFSEKTEARNPELEQTVKTLQRKIHLLEADIPVEPTYPVNVNDTAQHTTISRSPDTKTGELVIRLQSHVTKFILNKVAQQISILEQADCDQRLGTYPGDSSGSYEARNSQLSTHMPPRR